MTQLRSSALRILALIASTACTVSFAGAQVITPPIGGGAIKAAKAGVEKTNEQTQAAEKEGAAMKQQEKKAAAPTTQKAPQQAQQKAAPPPQKAGAAQTKSAAAPPQKGGQKAATPTQKAGQKAGSKADTSTGAVSESGGRRGAVTIYREAFNYSQQGQRDPFVSLMLSGELRPVITDLSLTGVLQDRDPRKSVALLVDASTGESYRVKVGQPLGRMRVQRIGREDITFSIEEFGLSRTETLVIDRTKKAAPAAARRP
jgi:hypothetical protein